MDTSVYILPTKLSNKINKIYLAVQIKENKKPGGQPGRFREYEV
jgi:hypothetical protein